jgi:hypothetical protein
VGWDDFVVVVVIVVSIKNGRGGGKCVWKHKGYNETTIAAIIRRQ